jgi:hypothetical protein
MLGVLALGFPAVGLGAASCVNFGDLTSPDASTDAPVSADVVVVDTTGDTQVAETGPAVDSGPAADSGPAELDATSDAPWCDAHPGHTYCFDFDYIGTPCIGAWNSPCPFLSGGANVVLDKTAFVSPPASMLSTAMNGNSGGGTYAVMNLTVMPNPTSVEVAMEIIAANNPPIGYAWLNIGYGSPSTPQEFYAASVGSGPSGVSAQLQFPTVTDGGFGYASTSFPLQALVPGDGGWTHVDFLIQFSPEWALTVSFGGELQVMQQVPGSTSLPDASANVALGIIAVGDGGPVSADYDNVTIDVH